MQRNRQRRREAERNADTQGPRQGPPPSGRAKAERGEAVESEGGAETQRLAEPREEGRRPAAPERHTGKSAETRGHWDWRRGGGERAAAGERPARRAPAGRSLPAALRGCGARAPSPGPRPPARPGPPARTLLKAKSSCLSFSRCGSAPCRRNRNFIILRPSARPRPPPPQPPQDAPHGPRGSRGAGGAPGGAPGGLGSGVRGGASGGRAQDLSEARLGQWAFPMRRPPRPRRLDNGRNWAPTLPRAREGTPAELAPQRGACRDL